MSPGIHDLLNPLRLLRALRRRAPVDPLATKKVTAASLLAAIRDAGGGMPTLLDIGSSGGSRNLWWWMLEQQHVAAVLIDMADWGDNSLESLPNVRRIKAAVGESETEREVSITRHPACSSCLPPDATVLAPYPVKAWFDVVRTATVTLQSYQQLAKAHGLSQPHFVKLDVQGFEGQVLRGMGDHLARAVCLEFECQMRPIYSGQETFFDLYQMMWEMGFRLRDLKPQGPFEGEALEFNSFWCRLPKTPAERLMTELWETANDIWPGINFEQIDEHERRKYTFNVRDQNDR